MTRLRFVTVRDLVDAFPIVREDLQLEPSDAPSLEFLKTLAGGEEVEKAVGFCAYLLPRREAVWWACQSIKRLQPERSHDENQALELAEHWVTEPEEDVRLAALDLGRERDHRLPTTWLALAAGWSGNTMPMGGGETVPIPLHQTARAVRSGILIAGSRHALKDRPELYRACVEDGVRLIGDDA